MNQDAFVKALKNGQRNFSGKELSGIDVDLDMIGCIILALCFTNCTFKGFSLRGKFFLSIKLIHCNCVSTVYIQRGNTEHELSAYKDVSHSYAYSPMKK